MKILFRILPVVALLFAASLVLAKGHANCTNILTECKFDDGSMFTAPVGSGAIDTSMATFGLVGDPDYYGTLDVGEINRNFLNTYFAERNANGAYLLGVYGPFRAYVIFTLNSAGTGYTAADLQINHYANGVVTAFVIDQLYNYTFTAAEAEAAAAERDSMIVPPTMPLGGGGIITEDGTVVQTSN